jgi:hypothetical protein
MNAAGIKVLRIRELKCRLKMKKEVQCLQNEQLALYLFAGLYSFKTRLDIY